MAFSAISFSANLTRLQEKAGISNYKLAKDLGISQTSIQNWKTEKTIPLPVYVGLIADYFGVSAEQLCGGEMSN